MAEHKFDVKDLGERCGFKLNSKALYLSPKGNLKKHTQRQTLAIILNFPKDQSTAGTSR